MVELPVDHPHKKRVTFRSAMHGEEEVSLEVLQVDAAVAVTLLDV